MIPERGVLYWWIETPHKWYFAQRLRRVLCERVD
jgi:hypothetical protein